MAEVEPEVSEPEWVTREYWLAGERREHAASQDYDRAILTLSSGTLALSATFLHDIAPNPVGCSVGLLVASWIFLVVAIVAIVVSYLSSQQAHRATMGDKDASRPTNVTRALTYFAGEGSVGGIVLFAIFALVNL